MKDLWQQVLHHLDKGNFSRLEDVLGGPQRFDEQIIKWFDKGKFKAEPEALAEAFTCACMLGREKVVAHLLDKGVDAYAGMKTGLSGFHYAASSGRLNVIELLIERSVPIEVESTYGATVFGQAMWSAVNERKPDHAPIIEALIAAGAVVDSGYQKWWDEQTVPSAETKQRVAGALRSVQK